MAHPEQNRNYGHAATAMDTSPPKEADIEAATNRIGMLTKRAGELRRQPECACQSTIRRGAVRAGR